MLQQFWKIAALYTHQKTGIHITWERDKAVARFCRNNMVPWIETTHSGVFNESKQKYDAVLKLYATNVRAPKITAPDTKAWENRNIDRVNMQVKAKYDELK